MTNAIYELTTYKTITNIYDNSNRYIGKLRYIELERMRVRKNYEEVFNTLMIKTTNVSCMGRVYCAFSYLINIILNRIGEENELSDRILFFISKMQSYIMASIDSVVFPIIQPSEFESYIDNVKRKDNRSATQIIFDIIYEPLIEPIIRKGGVI
jgi:hypothetical protein